MIKHIVALGILCAIPMTGFAETSNNIQPKSVNNSHHASEKKVSLLFVLRSQKATIEKTDKGYVLKLIKVDPDTLYFSDRPNRISGYINTDKFVNHWAKPESSFYKDPPNSAIVHASIDIKKGFKQAVAVEMSNPKIMKDGSIEFDLKLLNGKLNTGNFEYLSIFIDDESRAWLFEQEGEDVSLENPGWGEEAGE